MSLARPRVAGRAVPSVLRRAWIAASALAVAGIAAVVPLRQARAHHGFVGSYDFSRPLYLAGTVESVWIGMPHARLSLRQDPELALPRDRERFRALEDAESRQMLGRLRLLERPRVEVSLHPRLTRQLLGEPDAVPVGLRTELIGYRRTTRDEYRDEIVGVWIRLADGRVLAASSPPVSRPRRTTRD
jgi:hypothetical protein